MATFRLLLSPLAVAALRQAAVAVAVVAVMEVSALGQAAVAVAVVRGRVDIPTIAHPMVLAVVAGPRVYALVAGKDIS